MKMLNQLLIGAIVLICVIVFSKSYNNDELKQKKPIEMHQEENPSLESNIDPIVQLESGVAEWAKNNVLGEYFQQSLSRVNAARSKYEEDVRIRQQMGLGVAPKGEYVQVIKDHKDLCVHIYNCYKTDRIDPLPKKLRSKFQSKENSNSSGFVPLTVSNEYSQKFQLLLQKFTNLGMISWDTDKTKEQWNGICCQLSKLLEEAKLLRNSFDMLSRKNDTNFDYGLQVNIESLFNKINEAYGIAEGQVQVLEFKDLCDRMIIWINTLEARVQCKGRYSVVQNRKDGEQALQDINTFQKLIEPNAFRKYKIFNLPESGFGRADQLFNGVIENIPPSRSKNLERYFNLLESLALRLRN